MSPTTPLTSFGDFAISAQSAICIVIAKIIAFQDISYTTPQNRYTVIFPVSNLPSRKCFSAKDAGVGFLARIWSTLALMPKSGGEGRERRTAQVMSLQMINACEAPLTNCAAKVLVRGLHDCPLGKTERKRLPSFLLLSFLEGCERWKVQQSWDLPESRRFEGVGLCIGITVIQWISSTEWSADQQNNA